MNKKSNNSFIFLSVFLLILIVVSIVMYVYIKNNRNIDLKPENTEEKQEMINRIEVGTEINEQDKKEMIDNIQSY